MLQRRFLALAVLSLSGVGIAWTADYTGPRPPKPDMLYLVHADNLIPTEAGEAKEEGKGNSTKYVMPGATSPAVITTLRSASACSSAASSRRASSSPT